MEKLRIRRATCRVSIVEHERKPDVACGEPALYETTYMGYPICQRHAESSAHEGLSFDAGNYRVSIPVGASIKERE